MHCQASNFILTSVKTFSQMKCVPQLQPLLSDRLKKHRLQKEKGKEGGKEERRKQGRKQGRKGGRETDFSFKREIHVFS